MLWERLPAPVAATTPRAKPRFRGRALVVSLLVAMVAAPIVAAAVEQRRVAGLPPVSAKRPSVETPAARQVAAPQAAPQIASAPPPVVDADALVARVASDAMRWGKAALAEGDLGQAQAQFEAVVATEPGNADAWHYLGDIHLRQERVDAAIAAFDEAISRSPNRWTFRFNRARARGLRRQWSGAVEDYRAAAARVPNDLLTQYNLGLALMELQRFDAASRALERAVSLGPERPSLLVALGTAYLGADDQDQARRTFQRFLEMAPEDLDAPRVRTLLTELGDIPN